MRRLSLLMLCFSLVLSVNAQPRGWRDRTGMVITDPNVHDPVMALEDTTFYLFYTGMFVPRMSSTDLEHWRFERNVFPNAPQWAMDSVPGYRGHTWAPDIVHHYGKWHLYYSCSTFGKNRSVIGHAECTTLNPNDTLNSWHDTGLVVASHNQDDYNAIDPSVIVDAEGTPWMVFGSFWSGIQLVRLTPDMAHVDSAYSQRVIARRSRGKAIEAPFLYHHGDYYYLFVSWDYCCRKEQSDYKVVVGRSKHIEGPYLDRTGKSMLKGGGTFIYEGDDRMIAGGHSAAYTFRGEDYFICHGYTREYGESKLVLRKILWDNDWPILLCEER